jgi:hypothetical protein
VALLALGLECWVLAALVPRLRYGLPSPGDGLLAALPLAFLAAGCLAAGPSRIQSLSLLLAFPVTLAASVAARSDLTERDAWGPLTTALLAASLLGYLALAMVRVSEPALLRTSSPQPLPMEAQRHLSDHTRNGRLVLGLALAFGWVGIAILPFWDGRADTVLRFGDAADDAATLAVIVASLAFAIAAGAIIGPGLRARKRTDARREQMLARALPFVVLGLLAGLARAALFYLDSR